MLQILLYDTNPEFAKALADRISGLSCFCKNTMEISYLTDAKALLAKASSRCDLLLLEMPEDAFVGLNLVRQIRVKNPNLVVIFISDYLELARFGYEVQAFRYLAKSELCHHLEEYIRDAIQQCQPQENFITVLSGGEWLHLPIQNLIYIHCQGPEQHLHLHNTPRTPLPVRKTLLALEQELRGQGFLRIHKSYLVNMAYLEFLQSTCAMLTTGLKLPSGTRDYRKKLKQYLAWKQAQGNL
ncbi:MAG: LytTR family DNA-binding domain-containing protein [Candidatus Fournierella pullistercoris]|uniref:LytTR family DNA-binding domain-containing protein n=1 Tax=Candidatus Allofournierella pullistercoris TaxID=2838597 RepID=A0A948T1J3_9FIRM|nr:LytTR family DNA-binding domain-containing protein [Candidatus Fournierella pullistercoris]